MMKRPTLMILIGCVLIGGLSSLFAQGTAFSYHGRLNDDANPGNGGYDFIFTLFDDVLGGNVIGPPAVLDAVAVTSGEFAVQLDYGPGAFSGAPRWLEIQVRKQGVGEHAILEPRQSLLPAPYAIYAGSAGAVPAGTVGASQLNIGGPAPIPGQVLSYDGAGLSWTSGPGGGDGVFTLNGTSAYYLDGNIGLGTTLPAHRLSLAGGPIWTGNGWLGAVDLENAAAIAWQANAAGQRFGMGHSGGGFYMFRTASDPGAIDAPALYDFMISDEGKVGIGTTAPVSKLEVVGQDALRLVGYQPFLTLLDSNAGNARSVIQGVDGSINLLTESFLSGANPWSYLKVANNGNVGIGSSVPVGKLEVVAQDALRLIGYQPFLTLYDSNAGYAGGRIQSVGGAIILEPQAFLDGSNPNAHMTISPTGDVSVKNLTIRGGADLAEPFQLSTAGIAKGSVVVIDEEHPGKLKLSTEAYDTRVAGIISGANGVNPGISLHQEGLLDGGENVALSGRVYVHADAAYGAIQPGNLLTTSHTAGHAMKVTDHLRGQGAILGKAMTGLNEGRGMVLVLVTLQ